MNKRIVALFVVVLSFLSVTGVKGAEYGGEVPDWIDGEIIEATISEEPWVPEKGDRFLVNTTENYGQLIHSDGTTYTFPVLTGQQRVVRYIGRRYFAATPIKDWQAKDLEIKKDRVTFGDSGRFLRLYDKGEGTPYGIHPYKYYQYNLDKGNQYVSMGCVLVNEKLMDIIQKTWEVNDNNLEVKTVK